VAAGLTPPAIRHYCRQNGWRRVHAGVYALTHAPLTRRQVWVAATLSAPDSFLSHASAGACWGIRPFEGSYEVVTRPGTAGPRRLGSLLVCRSKSLAGNTTRHDGIAITTAERTVIDLAAQLNRRATGKMFREALRLRLTTVPALVAVLSSHPGARGIAHLRELAARYARLPYERTRSDAEGLALELLHDAELEPPLVNTRIAGEEADLAWPRRRAIIEIDGPQYHQFADETHARSVHGRGRGTRSAASRTTGSTTSSGSSSP
jgi:hypothetical protein